MHPEGPATGHLDTGFLGFPLSSSKYWDGSQVPSCYCMLLMQPSLSKFIKITPCCRATKLVNFQIISTLSNDSWNQILPSLSQAFTTHNPNVFNLILSLSEGRAGIAWVPSNKMLSLSPSDILISKGQSLCNCEHLLQLLLSLHISGHEPYSKPTTLCHV
jgi:hypothetical protein